MHCPLPALVAMTICFRTIAAFDHCSGTLLRRHVLISCHSSSAASLFSSAARTAQSRLKSSSTDDATAAETSSSSSFDFDEDESSEQLLADHPVAPPPPESAGINGADAGSVDGITKVDPTKPAGGRYDALLDSVGLGGNVIASLSDLNDLRPVSTNDVFCNRELKMSAIKAIGFDMDYTLAQYEQPAFDKLAFDGAKEKLVKALGYPEEVLDFEYDHKVREL